MKLNLVTLTLILAAVVAAVPARTTGNNGSNTYTGNNDSNGKNNNNPDTNSDSSNGSNSSNNTSLPTNSGTNAFQPASNTANNGVQNGNKTEDKAASQNGANSANQPNQVDAATAALMSTAVNAWMMDTGVVSNFLNIGNSLTKETTFMNQAQIAYSAEIDELTHKAVLDQFMPNNVNVQKANATLSNGAFQLVVDRLLDMAMQGRSQIQGITDINNDRCVNVLPNIDAYLREAALTIGNGQPIQQAIRPSACANIVPGQNGALQVGMPPPGYVNGKLQNGNSNT
jgi:hypothetical protein